MTTPQAFQASNFRVTCKEDLKIFSKKSGVYRIFNAQGELLYVGKAKDLQARVQFYFRNSYDNERIAQLVSQRKEIIITLTKGESQALWLEQNYIKEDRPKYNVLLLDDKSYPWICLTSEPYPRLRLHRGERIKKLGKYFGPFYSARSAYTIIKLLKKLFYIRQCKGSKKFSGQRPCLEHHLGYCAGPCFTGMFVEEEKYRQNILELKEFLSGKTQKVVERLAAKMRESSQHQDYDKALQYREQIRAIQQLTDRQGVQVMRHEETDLLAITVHAEWTCIYQLIVRNGGVVGGAPHFLKNAQELSEEEIFVQFIMQFYLADSNDDLLSWNTAIKEKHYPAVLFLPVSLKKIKEIQQTIKFSNLKSLKIESVGYDKEKRHLFDLAHLNAKQALDNELFHGIRRENLFDSLEKIFEIEDLQKIDCIDISHLQGSEMVGAVVRLVRNGLSYSNYRKYVLPEFDRSNDCAAIISTIKKRYQNIKKENLPEILIIDGGKSQFLAAQKIFDAWAAQEDFYTQIKILSLGKGKERRSGWEQVWSKSGAIGFDREKLWALLEVRDAAHNYAVRQHRKQRSKTFLSNFVEKIPGIGPKKYQVLLDFMGGIGKLKGASLEQIRAIPGISDVLAQRIWNTLHPEISPIV